MTFPISLDQGVPRWRRRFGRGIQAAARLGTNGQPRHGYQDSGHAKRRGDSPRRR